MINNHKLPQKNTRRSLGGENRELVIATLNALTIGIMNLNCLTVHFRIVSAAAEMVQADVKGSR